MVKHGPLIFAVLGGILIGSTATAGGSHGGGHDGQPHQDHGEHHAHDKWIDPPAAYARKVSHRWADAQAIARGEEIYQAQCLSCHGVDGMGSGALANSLAHPPADLTNNFHTAPGDGDAYLFWRVSEGGTVEPFRSQGSAMPAFKQTLSEEDRWDVLAYVHTFFHEGLARWIVEPSIQTRADPPPSREHDS